MNQNEPFFQNLYMRDTEKPKTFVQSTDDSGVIGTKRSGVIGTMLSLQSVPLVSLQAVPRFQFCFSICKGNLFFQFLAHRIAF